jgi:DNA-binding NtrC family response regulator
VKNILLIGDDSQCLNSLTNILNRLGYKSVSIQDGQHALFLLRERQLFDLVIIDCQMNGMAGLEILTGLQKTRPGLPVIMLTVSGTLESYLKALNLGVYEYVPKPVDANMVGKIVKSAIG